MGIILLATAFIFILYHNSEAWNIEIANDCDDLNENPKFFGEDCTNDSECYGTFMICKNKICKCDKNYEPELKVVGEAGVRRVCTLGPYLFNKCENDNCQKPLTCLNVTENDTLTKEIEIGIQSRPGRGYTDIIDEGFVIYPRNNFSGPIFVGNYCFCLPPYQILFAEMSLYKICALVCKGDEKYNDQIYSCEKVKKPQKCKPLQEINVNDTCESLVTIGQHCNVDGQCRTAFSECKNNKCSCRKNFVLKNGTCVPESFKCPLGNPLMKNKEVFICSAKKKPNRCPGCVTVYEQPDKPFSTPGDIPSYLLKEEGFVDDCPDGHYCSVTHAKMGHCCPLPKFECPVGKQLENVSCEQPYSNSNETFCPSETHYCHYLRSMDLQRTICCPKACRSDFMIVDGRCFAQKSFGKQCQVHEQCGYQYGECVEGVCLCSKNATIQEERCEIKCKSNQMLLNNTCVNAYQLGDYCKDTPDRCGPNLICSKSGKCVCKCGTIPFGKECIFPTDYAAPKTTLQETKQINETQIEQLFKGDVLCRIEGVESSVTGVKLVDKCPPDQYCKQYLTTVGVCHYRPDPTCRGSTAPKDSKSCNPYVLNSCGKNHFCYQYIFDLANSMAVDGAICCHE